MTSSQPTRVSRWPLYVIGALFAFGLLGTALWNVELPIIAWSPGPTSDAADLVVAEEVEVYPPEGELLMLTVIQQDANVFEAALAGLDPSVDLTAKRAVRREGETDEEYRNRVLQQMDDSNFRSVAVALDYLGYELEPTAVVVNELVEGVPAESVLLLGDTIKSINGTPVFSIEDIGRLLEGQSPGDEVDLTVLRDGEELSLTVELTERGDGSGAPIIGFVPGQLQKPPFPLEIRTGNTGGPSAGLMHTLAIIDTLTEGDLTRGHVIAGTGTIDQDGNVGNIGFPHLKAVAAEAAGAEFMFVPLGNYELALTAQHETLEIVPVATLDEAITFLEGLEEA